MKFSGIFIFESRNNELTFIEAALSYNTISVVFTSVGQVPGLESELQLITNRTRTGSRTGTRNCICEEPDVELVLGSSYVSNWNWNLIFFDNKFLEKRIRMGG